MNYKKLYTDIRILHLKKVLRKFFIKNIMATPLKLILKIQHLISVVK